MEANSKQTKKTPNKLVILLETASKYLNITLDFLQQYGRGWRDAFWRTSVQQLQWSFLMLCSVLRWRKSGITYPCLCPPTTPFPPHLSFLGQFSSYLSLFLNFQLCTPTSSSPAPLYQVTILKGTSLAHYIPYLPLTDIVKIHTDLAKKTILRKSLKGRQPLNIHGTTTGKSKATGLRQNLKSSLWRHRKYFVSRGLAVSYYRACPMLYSQN